MRRALVAAALLASGCAWRPILPSERARFSTGAHHLRVTTAEGPIELDGAHLDGDAVVARDDGERPLRLVVREGAPVERSVLTPRGAVGVAALAGGGAVVTVVGVVAGVVGLSCFFSHGRLEPKNLGCNQDEPTLGTRNTQPP